MARSRLSLPVHQLATINRQPGGTTMRDRIQVFGGNGNPELVREICAYLGLPIGRVDIRRFSNENLSIQVQENVRETDVFVVQPFSTPVHENIMELLIMMDALRSSSASRITAVIPYYSYARSDKKDAPRISITGRLMADLLVTAGADRVLAKIAASAVADVVVTNTVPVPLEKRIGKIRVLSVAPLFGEAIKRIHSGESISSLFV